MKNKTQPPQSPLREERIKRGLWWDKALTLVEGCTMVSEACHNCWAATQTHTRAKQTNPKTKARYQGLTTDKGQFNGTIRMQWEALKIPLSIKTPTRFAVWNDLFHPEVTDEFIAKAWDMMWLAHRHTFIILTKRPERMAQWVRENACVGHFDWVKSGREPFQPGEVIAFDDFFYRYRCGWNGWNDEWRGYYCDHSENDGRDEGEREESCGEHECPLVQSDPHKTAVERWGWNPDEYTVCEDGYVEDSNKVELWTRPRYGSASNIILMTTIESNKYLDRLEYLERIKEEVPFYKLGVSIEPAIGPVDLAEFLSRRYKWDKFSGKKDEPLIDWIIMGCESGNKEVRRPMDIEWVRAIQKQCADAGVAFFLKQMKVGGKVVGLPELDGKQYAEFPRRNDSPQQ